MSIYQSTQSSLYYLWSIIPLIDPFLNWLPPLCFYREDFPYFRLLAHCQFPTLTAWASLPNAAILYSKNYALWTSRPYAYGSKRWPFFSVNKSIVHRRSSMSSSSCYAMCVLTLVVLACSIPVKCQTPKLLGTITLLYFGNGIRDHLFPNEGRTCGRQVPTPICPS